MQRYKKIYGRESPKEFVPIFQSQNTFKTTKKQNNTTEKDSIKNEISKIKNQTNNAKGNKRNPNVLSNKKEKKIASLARSLALNSEPISFINIIFKKKNKNTNNKTNTISDKSNNCLNFEIIRVIFIIINKNVSKPTLSVKALSSLKN